VWSLVYGGAVTLLVTGVLAWSLAPVRPRFGRSQQELGGLLGFSLPVWLSKLTYVAVQQGSVLTLSTMLGMADVGQFKSAEQLASLVFYVEVVLGQTVFPAYCRLAHSDDALSSAFVTASRLSMAWIGAAAAGLMLFAHDIVQFVLTPAWSGTELFLRAQGGALIFGAALFNWDAVFKARNDTGPLLRMALLFLLTFVGLFVPLVYVFGRRGAAAGLVATAAVTLAARVYHIRKLNLQISVNAVMRPAVMAAGTGAFVSVACSLSLGWPAGADQSSPLQAAARVLLFVLIYAVVLYRLDGALLRSAAAVLVGRTPTSPAHEPV
jgi:O-antigen/teichoic acid export membrane protein